MLFEPGLGKFVDRRHSHRPRAMQQRAQESVDANEVTGDARPEQDLVVEQHRVVELTA
ncbi:MAG: hypothetical protein ACTHU0_27165 [Kofleriaceae bacterium]